MTENTKSNLPEPVDNFYQPSGKSAPGTFIVWAGICLLALAAGYVLAYLVGKLAVTWALFIRKEMADEWIYQIMSMILYLLFFASPLMIPITFFIVFLFLGETTKCRNPNMSYYVFALIGPAIVASGYYVMTTCFQDRVTPPWMWTIIVIVTLLTLFAFIILEGAIRMTPYCETCQQRMKKETPGTFIINSVPGMLAILQNQDDLHSHFSKLVRIDQETMASDRKPSDYAVLTSFSCECENKPRYYDFHAHQGWVQKLIFSGPMAPRAQAAMEDRLDQVTAHKILEWHDHNPDQNMETLTIYIREQLAEPDIKLVGMGVRGVTNRQTVIRDMKQAFLSGAVGLPAPVLVKNADWVGNLIILAVAREKLHILDLGRVPLDSFSHDLVPGVIAYALNACLNPNRVSYLMAQLKSEYDKNRLTLQGPENFSSEIDLQQHHGLEKAGSADQFVQIIEKAV